MIGEMYPDAVRHLGEALESRRRLADRWQGYLDDGLVEDVAVTDRDGTGRITVIARWPAGARAELTREFRACTAALWSCLDALVAETVNSLGVLRQPRESHRPRFFPVADSPDGLDALLEESCPNGVLVAHHQLVRACQPFRTTPDDPTTVQVRDGLRHLLDWTHRLEDGALVGAWVTPVAPALHLTTPVELLELLVAEPGPLEHERVVATYRLGNYTVGGVSAQAGTYVDLAFPDGYRPTDADDTFDRRSTAVTDAVIRIAGFFAATTSRVAGARRLAGRTTDGPRTDWTPAWASPRRWSTADLAALDRSDIGLGVVVNAEKLTLLVTTDDGVHERVIPAPSALNPHLPRGTAAEAATHNAAATWGLPDFVILPLAEHRGSRNREISDGLLVTGERGVVLQIKSRAAAGDRPDRETSWVDRKVAEAVRQVNGTVRRLRSAPSDMVNGRGRTVSVGGASTSWVGVVIIDHPAPPSDHPLLRSAGGVPVVTLLRRDWEFLFDQLRSTRAVVDYLYRVGGSTALLGAEPERYFELAAVDAAAPPGPLDPSLGGVRVSTPLLPAAPAGHDDDQAHGLVRLICEDIANTPSDYDATALLSVLSTIDTPPVSYRTELGLFLLDALRTAADTVAGGVSWRFRIVNRGLDAALLGFGVCSRFDATVHAAFQYWVLLRHHERVPADQLHRLDQALTVGVLLTPRSDGVRDFDTTLIAVRGDPQLSEEELTASRALWNRPAELG